MKHEKLGSDGGIDPSESACRGRLQTTPERHWSKTVVVSVGGEGGSRWSVGCGSGRRVQANHRQGADTEYATSKPETTTISWTSPLETCLLGGRCPA